MSSKTITPAIGSIGYYKSCYNGSVATFTPDQLRLARETVGFTQQQAAKQFGVSQAYLALMETGRRRVTEEVGLKMMDLYPLGPTVLSLRVAALESWDSHTWPRLSLTLGTLASGI